MPISGCKNTKIFGRLADVSEVLGETFAGKKKKRIFAALFIQFQL